MNFKQIAFVGLILGGCTSTLVGPYSFTYIPIRTDTFDIATWQATTNTTSPIHIYIEGDGYAFNKYGQPTKDPTPRKFLMRNLAARDEAPNVAYIGRPCQYIKNNKCDVSDWTDGRFSSDAVDAVYNAIKIVAKGRPIILIGYSGGAMISGLIIKKHPDLNVKKWITVAGVLNHADWTKHFGDSPLNKSLNMNPLPRISQTHYIAEHDSVVPNSLSYKWANKADIVVVPDATHTNFSDLKIDFD